MVLTFVCQNKWGGIHPWCNNTLLLFSFLLPAPSPSRTRPLLLFLSLQPPPQFLSLVGLPFFFLLLSLSLFCFRFLGYLFVCPCALRFPTNELLSERTALFQVHQASDECCSVGVSGSSSNSYGNSGSIQSVGFAVAAAVTVVVVDNDGDIGGLLSPSAERLCVLLCIEERTKERANRRSNEPTNEPEPAGWNGLRASLLIPVSLWSPK